MAASEHQMQSLMGRSLTGDKRAHEDFLRELAPMLQSYYRRRIRDVASDADDLVQECLIAVHQRRASYDPHRPVMPWVYAIARYKLADYFRRRGAFQLQLALDDSYGEFEFESSCSSKMDIERLLADLPAKQRKAIKATKIAGDSVADFAAASGMSQSDVKVSVHRGLKTLASRISGVKS